MIKASAECFQNDEQELTLTKEEFTNWRSQFATSNSSDKMGL